MSLYQYIQNKPVIRNEMDKEQHKVILSTIAAVLKGKAFTSEDNSMLDLSGLTFEDVNLNACQWITANLAFTTFSNCSARNSDFSGANLEECVMANTDLFGSKLIEANNITPHSFPGCNLNQSLFPDEFFPKPTPMSMYLFKSLIPILMFTIYLSLTMSDVAIFSNTITYKIPDFPIDINSSLFFYLMPLVLLLVHIFIHIELNRFYSTRFSLPYIFPDSSNYDSFNLLTPFDFKYQSGFTRAPAISRFFQNVYIYCVFFYSTPTVVMIMCSRTVSTQNQIMIYETLIISLLLLGFSIWLISKTCATNYTSYPIYLRSTFFLFIIISALCIVQSRDYLIITGKEVSPKLKLVGRSFNKLKADGAVLASPDLGQTSLRGADLKWAMMQGSSLVLADLTGAALDHTLLGQSDLREADLNQVKLFDCDLSGALNLTTIRNFPSTVIRTRFDNTDLRNWRLPANPSSPAQISPYNFSNCSFVNSDLSTPATQITATFTECNFQSAQLDAGIFEDCEFISTDMPSIIAFNTSFANSKFNKVNLTGATLVGANFTLCKFEGGCYISVDLTSCIFDFADFKQADLSGAKINREQLITCTFDEGTRFPDSFYE